LIIEPFHACQAQTTETPQKWPFLVIIDGLDNREGAMEGGIISSIADLINAHHIPLRFLIATRPRPHIRRSFQSADFQYILSRICVDEPMKDFYKSFVSWFLGSKVTLRVSFVSREP